MLQPAENTLTLEHQVTIFNTSLKSRNQFQMTRVDTGCEYFYVAFQGIGILPFRVGIVSPNQGC
jgi:hypothetical protein